MASDASAFIPDLDAARGAGLLLPGSHAETEKLAALVVSARAIEVDAWARTSPFDVEGRKRPSTLFEIYVPDVLKTAAGMFHFETTLEGWICPSGIDPPEVLRCHDLKPRQSGGAYRQAQVTRPPDFHGHMFGDTIEQAIEALERFFLGHRDKKFDIRAWAWPLLVLREKRNPLPAHTTVLLVTASGERVAFAAGTGIEDD